MRSYFLIVFLFLGINPVCFAKENATWIKSTFFRGFDPVSKKKLELKDTEALGARLKANNIRYAYIFAGPFNHKGNLPEYVFSKQAKESIESLKKVYPGLKILPWIGGVQNKSIHLERVEWVKNAIAATVKLVKDVPVDGIHLDLEYVLYPVAKFNFKKLGTNDYGTHWVNFHKQLRTALPNEFLSSVVVSTASGTKPWKHKHSLAEVKEVSLIADQISFMFYETSIHELKSYRDNLKEQLEHIKNLKSELNQKSPQYLIGVGTFNIQKKLASYRDPRFENLPTTLKLINELDTEISLKTSIIDGLAIFCEWETSDQEWDELQSYTSAPKLLPTE